MHRLFYVKEREGRRGVGLSQIKTPGSFFTGIIALHVVNGVIFWYLKLWQGSSRNDLLAAANAGKATARRKGRRGARVREGTTSPMLAGQLEGF